MPHSEYQSATRLIPWLWLPYQVNPWELDTSVPLVIWCTTEDKAMSSAGHVLLQEYIPYGRYVARQKEENYCLPPPTKEFNGHSKELRSLIKYV